MKVKADRDLTTLTDVEKKRLSALWAQYRFMRERQEYILCDRLRAQLLEWGVIGVDSRRPQWLDVCENSQHRAARLEARARAS